MALFKRKDKKIEDNTEPKVEETVELTEEEQHERDARAVFDLKKVYTILSAQQAHMMKGVSFPQLLMTSDKKIVFPIFSSPENARKFMDEKKMEVLDGLYLIGELTVHGTEKPMEPTLDVALATALAMGASILDFNTCSEGAFGCSLPWFMKVNDVKKDVVVLTTKEMTESLKNDPEQKLPLRFNACPIYQFDYKYDMNEIVGKNIMERVLKSHTSEEELVSALNRMDLFELCHAFNVVQRNFIPIAEKDHPQDLPGFKEILKNVEIIVKEKLMEEEKLFYLVDAQSGELIVNQGYSYLIYTDRFKYMSGPKVYREIKPEEAFDFFKNKGIDKIIVTDGPHGMAFINI